MSQDASFTEKNLEEFAAGCHGEFEDCEFDGIKFSQLNIRPSSFFDCKFKNCNLAGIDLLGSTFRDAQFSDCNLMGLNWSSIKRFENCSFQNCKLDLSSFQTLKLKRLSCIDCSMKEVDFSDANLAESDFSGSTLTGASFTRSDLSKANFKTARDYFIDPTFTKVKGAKFRLPEAMTLLAALGVEVDF